MNIRKVQNQIETFLETSDAYYKQCEKFYDCHRDDNAQVEEKCDYLEDAMQHSFDLLVGMTGFDIDKCVHLTCLYSQGDKIEALNMLKAA